MLKNVAMALGLVLAIGFVYYPVAQHGFVSFDDRVFITENPHVKAGLTPDGLRWALTSTEQGTWHPLTWLSLMLDCQWFGLNAGPHHLMSVLLHAISTVLLFYVLVSMTGRRWPSAVVAALFALHPLHVESVAWASERKDTLSTVFWMLTLLAYVGYVRRPGLVRYAAVFVALALGLMSKPMLVTLPFVLLLLDFWPLGRTPWAAPARVEDPSQTRRGGPWRAERDRPPWRTVPRLVLEKVPLFALVAAASAATYLTQNSEGAMKFAGRFPPMFRYAGAAVAYVEYVRQTFWPTGLAYFYPFEFHPLWKGLAAAIALAVVTALVLWQLRRRPYLAVGWFWYVGTLIPVAGFIQIGSQARADRYTYVPLIGVFVAVVWGVADALAGWRHRAKILAPLAACAVVACAIVAWQQVQVWRDSAALFNHAIAVTENNALAHASRGYMLFEEKHYAEAEAEYREAARISPGDSEVRTQLARALAQQGRRAEAIVQLGEALRIEPDYGTAHGSLGTVLALDGQLAQAVVQYRIALRSEPNDPVWHNNLGEALARLGQTDEALTEFHEAVRLRPDLSQAHNNMAMILAGRGRLDEAMEQYHEAVRLVPNEPAPHVNMAAVFFGLKRWEDAIAECREAVRLDPRQPQPQAENTWGSCLLAQGKLDEAAAHFAQALRLKPDYANARHNLAVLLVRAGKPREAIAEFTTVLQLEPTSVDARRGLAMALVSLGRFEEAAAPLAEALRLRPDWPPALKLMAWIRATAPEASLRNGPEAVRLAGQACQLTGGQDSDALDALAAAYAEAGRFDEAVRAARDAAALARAQGRTDAAAQIDLRVKLYESGKPYRVTSAPAP
jgi:Flp pilus assembly protein TadD